MIITKIQTFYCNYKQHFFPCFFLKIHTLHHSSTISDTIPILSSVISIFKRNFKRKHFTNTDTRQIWKQKRRKTFLSINKERKKKKRNKFPSHVQSFVCTVSRGRYITSPLPHIRIFLSCKTITRGGRCTQIPSRLTTPCLRGDRSIKPSNY